ncbi:MAG: nitroreductase [Anaerolineae bacterium]|nr:nitroreductase [Anaerolineae bacterium]
MACPVSVKRVLTDGAILSVLLSVLVYGSIYVDPLLWVSDYPPDIQSAVGASEVPSTLTIVLGVLFLGLTVAVVLWSNAKLRRERGGELSLLAAFANSALILLFFATWDLLILDWLIFVTIQPGFIVIPGTEGLAGYKDYWFHFEAGFLGWTQWIAILAGGLAMGGLSMFRFRRAA